MGDLKTVAEVFGPWGAIVLFTIYLIYQYFKDKAKFKREKIKEEQKLEQEKIDKADDIDFRKTLNKQIQTTSEVNKDILKYLKISSEKYIDEVNESQARIIIEFVLSCSENDIRDYSLRILKENHIVGHEREVSAKLKTFISNRYHKDILVFKEFHLKGISISTFMKPEWKDYVTEVIIELIINQKESKAIVSTLENAFESFKCDMLDSTL